MICKLWKRSLRTICTKLKEKSSQGGDPVHEFAKSRSWQKQNLLDLYNLHIYANLCKRVIKYGIGQFAKKWSVGQFAMKFPCMDKVLYGENKVLNCAIVSSSHCHCRQMVQSFLRSQTEHIRRGLSNHKKLRLLQVTRFFVDTFFLRPPVRSGLSAATRKKRGFQIDFDISYYWAVCVHILLVG